MDRLALEKSKLFFWKTWKKCELWPYSFFLKKGQELANRYKESLSKENFFFYIMTAPAELLISSRNPIQQEIEEKFQREIEAAHDSSPKWAVRVIFLA